MGQTCDTIRRSASEDLLCATDEFGTRLIQGAIIETYICSVQQASEASGQDVLLPFANHLVGRNEFAILWEKFGLYYYFTLDPNYMPFARTCVVTGRFESPCTKNTRFWSRVSSLKTFHIEIFNYTFGKRGSALGYR